MKIRPLLVLPFACIVLHTACDGASTDDAPAAATSSDDGGTGTPNETRDTRDAGDTRDASDTRDAGDDGTADASVDGGAPSTHEPKGMTVVGPGVNPTSVLPPLQPTTDAWGQAYYAGQLRWPEGTGRNTLSVIDDPTAPFAPTTYYRLLFPKGISGGVAPARWNLAGKFPALGGPVKKIYFSFWIRYSQNYHSGSKLVFFSQRDGNNHYVILANDVDGTNFETVIQNQNLNFERVAAPSPDIHRWNFVEVYLETGSPGQHDGVGRLWVNGKVLLDKTNFAFFGTNATAQWENLWMDPTYGGPATADEHADFGHVYVSIAR